MDELSDIEKVIFEGPKREIIIESPVVTALNMQGQKMYQISGGNITEIKKEKELPIPEEDVLLVSQQANVSMERARTALEEAEGDLARAILLITTG